MRCRDADTLTAKSTLSGHQLGVISVDTNNSGKREFPASVRPRARAARRAAPDRAAFAHAALACGAVAASSSLDSHMRVWDVMTGDALFTHDCGPVECWTLAFDPTKPSMLASGSQSGDVHIWDVETGTPSRAAAPSCRFVVPMPVVRCDAPARP